MNLLNQSDCEIGPRDAARRDWESFAGADGSFEDLLETTWPSSDLTARPCLASAASERHFSPGSPEETPLHKMLFLPAAALCCLCSALVTMAAEQLIQEQLSQTGRAGETVAISCKSTDQCDKKQIYWYQNTEKHPLKVILRIDLADGAVNSRYNHPQKLDFSALRKPGGCELVIKDIKPHHTATYYCVCWKGSGGSGTESNSYLIFGSGTKLYVTDKPTVKPEVTAYKAANSTSLGGKSALVCMASGMFPPLVRFSWKREKNGRLEDLPPAEAEQLEIKEPGRVTAITVLDQGDIYSYKYHCEVNHEKGKVTGQNKIEIRGPSPPPLPPPHWFKERLLCLMYTVLIAKSLAYFCGLSLLGIMRKKGRSTNSTPAN
ncbi:immunoglobulin lambda-1 light chain [Oreochromis niloticus]|uniref:immunoglobulin lambda-1 light chain n=1 Tax=Oreochromis niloticus TaxID=8128 RepID=UPI000DF414EF|nr:immunoglobulin lambda-1 light chain [Oreochromis niloticus]